MVRGKGPQRTLTHGEISDIKGQKTDIDATIKHLRDNPGTSRSESISVGGLIKQKAHLDRILDTQSPHAPRSGVKKDEMLREAKEIEKRIRVGLPTRDQMDHPARNPGAVHKHLNWMKRTDKDVRRYKEIMRIIEPQDPTAMDIEKFRKNK